MKLIWYLWILLTLAILALWSSQAHGSVANRTDSLGLPQDLLNPYSYILGLPVDGQVLEGKATVIRVQPYGAPLLLDQSLTFCGDVTDKFDGKVGPLVIAYETQAHTLYRGVACHDVLGVFEVKSE
jgi:hypothetical protein